MSDDHLLLLTCILLYVSVPTASIKIRESHKHSNASYIPSYTKVADIKESLEQNKEFLTDLNHPR